MLELTNIAVELKNLLASFTNSFDKYFLLLCQSFQGPFRALILEVRSAHLFDVDSLLFEAELHFIEFVSEFELSSLIVVSL